MLSRLVFIAAFPILASAQPINSASFRVPGMPGYGVARGSMFTVYGNFLGPSGGATATSLPLTANLAGTSLKVTVGSTSVDALIYYTSYTQVSAVLPSTTPSGNGIVVLTFNGRVSNPIAISVVDTSFGIFTRNQAGFGPGIVQNYIDGSNAPTNALNATLIPGQTAVIWGTGLGAISGSDGGVPPVGNIGSDVSVLIGGETVTPDYAGRSGSYPAIDQINFKVPENVTGCFVPLVVKAGGIVSNYTSVSIAANGGTCSDYTSYAVASDIDNAVQKGQSQIGSILATSVAPYDPVLGQTSATDFGMAEFQARSSTALLAATGPMDPVPALGTCTGSTFKINSSDTTTVTPADPVQTTMLTAGLAIALNGVLMPLDARKVYSSSLPSGTLSVGPLTAQGGRIGDNVGSFVKTVQIRPWLTWSNASDIAGANLSRTQALKFTWTGGDSTRDFVIVRGISTAGGIRGSFVCAADAASGSITVPVEVLSVLPAGNSSGSDFVEIGTATRLDLGRFDASGLDSGYLQVRRLLRARASFQ